VDCKPLSRNEVTDILEGHGYNELAFSSLAMSMPRHGMMPSKVRDLSLSGMQRAVGKGDESGWCTACFTRRYPTPIPDYQVAEAVK